MSALLPKKTLVERGTHGLSVGLMQYRQATKFASRQRAHFPSDCLRRIESVYPDRCAGRKLRDSFEVTVLPTRQAPAQHASRDAADVLKAMHDPARDEDDAAGSGLDSLIGDPLQRSDQPQSRRRNAYDYDGEYQFPTVQHWTAPVIRARPR